MNTTIEQMTDAELATAVKQGYKAAIEEAANRFVDSVNKKTKVFPIEDLINEICQRTEVSIDDIKGKSHRVEITRAKSVAMWAIQIAKPNFKPRTIGEILRKDRNTVLHNIRKVENVTNKSDPDLYNLKMEIEQIINSY